MLWGFGVAILFADQWTKRTVRISTAYRKMALGRVVQFRFVEHRARAYDQTWARVAFVVTWLLAVAGATVLHRLGTWFQSPLALAGLGLACGGAASNLVDIIRRRYVVDYIDLGWWPVFNLADAGIVAGLAAAFLG